MAAVRTRQAEAEAPPPATAPPPAVAAPTPRRGQPAALEAIDANCTSAAAPSPASSPSKVAPVAHAFAEGSYSGSWACNRPEGRGTYTSHLGSSFSGVWRRGWADGAGVYHWADGRCDLGRFVGEAERLPLLAAVGEGVRWNRERTRASLLKNGVEVDEEISRGRAEAIADKLGLAPAVPPPRLPTTHAPARVSKRELETTLSFLTKRQRTAVGDSLAAGLGNSATADAEADAVPFEVLWSAICPRQ